MAAAGAVPKLHLTRAPLSPPPPPTPSPPRATQRAQLPAERQVSGRATLLGAGALPHRFPPSGRPGSAAVRGSAPRRPRRPRGPAERALGTRAAGEGEVGPGRLPRGEDGCRGRGGRAGGGARRPLLPPRIPVFKAWSGFVSRRKYEVKNWTDE